MNALDLLYPALAVAFFATMIAYVRFCVWLGQTDPDAAGPEETR